MINGGQTANILPHPPYRDCGGLRYVAVCSRYKLGHDGIESFWTIRFKYCLKLRFAIGLVWRDDPADEHQKQIGDFGSSCVVWVTFCTHCDGHDTHLHHAKYFEHLRPISVEQVDFAGYRPLAGDSVSIELQYSRSANSVYVTALNGAHFEEPKLLFYGGAHISLVDLNPYFAIDSHTSEQIVRIQ